MILPALYLAELIDISDSWCEDGFTIKHLDKFCYSSLGEIVKYAQGSRESPVHTYIWKHQL